MSIGKTPLFTAAALATLMLANAGSAALAHDTRPIDRVQARQAQAIAEGRRDGSITRREYRELVRQQAYIADLKRQAKADGRVTGREVRAIRAAQRDARTHIAHERSDRQVNIWRRWKTRYGL